MRISDWSSDVCSSDLIEWAVMYGDADAGTHIDAASPAPAQPRRRVICAATRVHAHKGIGRGAADAAKRLESFAPPAKLDVHAGFELGRRDRSHVVRIDADPQFRSEGHTSDLQSLM